MTEGMHLSCHIEGTRTSLVFTDPSKGPLRIVKIVGGQEVETWHFDEQTTEEIGEWLAMNTGDHIAWAIWRLKDIAENDKDPSIQVTACEAIVRCVTKMAGMLGGEE